MQINVEGTADQIPLHAAARAGRADIVQLLVESGANVEMKVCYVNQLIIIIIITTGLSVASIPGRLKHGLAWVIVRI